MKFLLIVTDDLWYHNPVQLIEVFWPIRIFVRFQPEINQSKIKNIVAKVKNKKNVLNNYKVKNVKL